MNYLLHYETIITRSKNRILNGYSEKHHIIPKCLGGLDNKSNIAILTGREHFICHQLLAKAYPDNPSLGSAAHMMTVKSKNQSRSENRTYEWLKKRYSKSMSVLQGGNNNSQFGKCWISNLSEQRTMRILKEDLDKWLADGWIKKRIIKFSNFKCNVCRNAHSRPNSNYCSDECKHIKLKSAPRSSKFKYNLDALCEEYKITKSVKRSLINLGLCGTGTHARDLMSELKKRNIGPWCN